MKRHNVFLLLALFLSVVPSSVSQDLKKVEDLVVDVNLATLTVRIADQRGRPMTGLNSNDLELFENGQLKSIQYFEPQTDPIAFGLLVDRSISIGNIKDTLDTSVSTLLEQIAPTDEINVMTFARRFKVHDDVQKNRKKVLKAIKNSKLEFGTRYYDAVISGLRQLSRSPLKHKVLIVVTDAADHGSESTYEDAIEAARRFGYSIHIVGYTGDDPLTWTEAGRRVIRWQCEKLAGVSGGDVIYPANEREFGDAVARIINGQQSRYRLTYYSSEAEWRKADVEIRVRGKQAAQLTATPSF